MALLPISHISLRTLMQRRRLIADAMQHITVHQKKLFQLPEEARPCLTKYCKYIPSSLNGHSRQRAALLFTHSCKRPGSVTDTISAPIPSPPPPQPRARGCPLTGASLYKVTIPARQSSFLHCLFLLPRLPTFVPGVFVPLDQRSLVSSSLHSKERRLEV